jgi:ligand-binding sensor domain-containing protein/serine phosphatase RsbU (regulator of sigma subunit)
MKLFRALRFLAVMLAFSLACFPSDPVFKTLSIEHGLSQSIVNAVIQDSRGFMWFVTEDGLNRYDGYTFKVFKPDPKNSFSLAHNEIKSICEGSDGTLWIGSFYKGLEHFDPATERFTHFQHNAADPASLSHNIVWAVLEDHAGRLWVGTGGGGLNLLDREKGTFTHYRHNPSDPNSLSDDDIRVLYEDLSGVLWIGTQGGGLNRLDPTKGSITHFSSIPSDPHSLSNNDVRAIVQTPDGAIWAGTNGGGLNRLDPATGKFRRFQYAAGTSTSLANNLVLALLIDPSGALWVGTDGGGLNRLTDINSGSFARYTHDPKSPQSIASNRVYSLCLDSSLVLWAGTYGSGVSRCDLRKKEFLLYANDPGDPESLSDNIVWSFCEPQKGVLWVGTNDGGLNRMDRTTGKFTRFLHDPSNPRSLSHNCVRMVISDRESRLWLATNGGGLDRFDPKTGIFTHYRHESGRTASLSLDDLRTVFQDRGGTIWVGTYGGGLDRWDPGSDSFFHYRSVPEDPKTISSDYVRTIYEDSDGTLWLGTHGGGLNRFDKAAGTFKRFRNDPLDPATLSNDYVYSIHEDGAGAFWIATFGGGLNRMDRKASTFSALRKTDGLPDDVIYGILEDKENNLWLSTNSGIAKYSPKTGAVRGYTSEDGLQSNEFNGGAYYKNQWGEMFFGGIKGFNVFDPSRILDDPFMSPLVLTDFKISNHAVPIGAMEDGRTLLSRSITYTDQIQLEHGDQVVSFEFASMDFAAPEKNQYAYKLEGLQDEWTVLGSRRFIMFTTLPAGSYNLRVKGTNSDGLWNDDGVSLGMIVRPPWWRTIWAYSLYFLMLVGIVFAIVRFEKAREREKHQLVQAELKAQAAELQSRMIEAESRAIKIENERKTQELEEARQLQLSMLPASMPLHPLYTLAARIRTATEVGGDYYDVHVDDEGVITLAIGDATGHGTRAGIMVSIMKGLFSRLCAEPELDVIFNECNRTLRSIGLGQIFMALGILRIKDGEARAMGAAMPPFFIHRAATGTVERSPLSGMFLGTEIDLPYEEIRFNILPGDTILLISDGYIEQMGPDEELLDYERCVDYFREAAGYPPEVILEELFVRFDAWRGTLPQFDDVTLVAIHAKA